MAWRIELPATKENPLWDSGNSLMTTISPILADVVTADMGFLPGLALFGPAFELPLSVLAAVLERPFYTRAGISRWALRW